MNKGILIIISGFSGSGKGTLVKRLMQKYDNYALSISATTRKPRENEIDGKDYFFISKDEFLKKIEKGDFIEYATYVDNYYATPKEYVESMIKNGKDVILEIEMQGALSVKEKLPDTLLIFTTPPDAVTLKNRLTGRGTESPQEIEARLNRAILEVEYMKDYDYIVINDTIDETVDDIHNLIRSYKNKVSLNKDFIEKIEKNMKQNFLGGI